MHCRSTVGWYHRPAGTFVAIGLANNGTTGSVTGPADGQNSNGTEIAVGSRSTANHYWSAATTGTGTLQFCRSKNCKAKKVVSYCHRP